MRWRYLSLTYQFGGPSTSLERHFRELREAMLHQSQHYNLLQPAAPWRPLMDIHETPDAIAVKIELAGMREEDIEISLYPNALVVTGRRDDDFDHDETICYHEAQLRYGPFRADVLLGVPIQQEAAEASYQNGFLRILLPKAATAPQNSDESDQPSEQNASPNSAHVEGALSGITQDAECAPSQRAGHILERLP
jgi:HSP20 family molecular chaperone IbpA